MSDMRCSRDGRYVYIGDSLISEIFGHIRGNVHIVVLLHQVSITRPYRHICKKHYYFCESWDQTNNLAYL